MDEKSAFTAEERARWHRDRRRGAGSHSDTPWPVSDECIPCKQPIARHALAAEPSGFCDNCLDRD